MPARTKSCATCRRRRIKCDATVPQCRMCIRTGHECPGLPDGPLFVDMTNTAKYGMQKRKSKVLMEDLGPSAQALVRPDDMLPYHISQRAVVTEVFYARFLAYFASEGEGNDIRNRRNWLHSLPILTTDGTNETLVLALQATASAYCAVESGNLALTQHSWKLYGEALRTHSRFVSRPLTRHEVTVHMVSTSVLFSFFEAMQATDADAYRSHIYGAVQMLEVTTPKQCSQGVLCQIFYHLRTQMAFISLTSKAKETPVHVQGILYGSLEYIRLPIFQRLMSHVSELVEMYVGSMNNASQHQTEPQTYTNIGTNIETLWLEYADEAANADTRLFWEDVLTGTMRFRDDFTALTVAYFSAALILLSITVPYPALSSSTLPDPHSTILQVSQYLQTYTVGCAYMRMATPLLLVALHSPEASQRKQATTYFERWMQKSMSGISALALDKIRLHQVRDDQLSGPAF